MRVLHVYSGNLFGGIETMLLTLARKRDLCSEMTPQFALCFEGRLSEELRTTGVDVFQLGNVRASRPRSVWKARRAFRDLLRRESADVAICHGAWAHAMFGRVVRAAKIPLVFWLHDATEGRHWLEVWARRTPPDLAICNSFFTASTLPNLFPVVRTEVIYCPVALSDNTDRNATRSQVRAELGTSEGARVIIQVSRLERMKGHALHIEALSAMSTDADWTCWMVGGTQRPQETALLDELHGIAENRGIAPRLRFLGDRNDVPRLMAAADIYCQPNTGPEGFGLTFIEAMGAALPIVTTDIGGARETVDPSCGILVPPDDREGLAIALQTLIDDPVLCREFGEKGSARANVLCDPGSQLSALNRACVGVAGYRVQ